MDNILCRFIADRNTPILDNIERYCVSENKDELIIIRIVFNFLEGIKMQLDDSFIKACMRDILEKADEHTKRAFSYFGISQIRTIEGCESIAEITKEQLKKIEGGKGNVTELMYFLINSNKTEWEKFIMLQKMVDKASNMLYMAMLTDLYISEESGVSIGYIDHLGNKATHIYTRLQFIEDIELVNAQYDCLIEGKQSKPKTNNTLLQITDKHADSYEIIFRSPWKEHTASFEKVLESNGYIKDGQWIGESKKKSELAELFYYLQEKGIIAQGEESKQLILLYSKFGLIVGKNNTKNGEYCTIRGLINMKGLSGTKDRFDRIFKQWVDQKFA